MNPVSPAYTGAAWFARFASPLFLGIQMLILLDMTQAWNDAWVEKGDEDERYLYGLLGITGGWWVGSALKGCTWWRPVLWTLLLTLPCNCEVGLDMGSFRGLTAVCVWCCGPYALPTVVWCVCKQ